MLSGNYVSSVVVVFFLFTFFAIHTCMSGMHFLIFYKINL